MAKPSFLNLWSSYPTEDAPCDGPWANQCAIRMSLALNGEQTLTVSGTTYTEPKCAHGHARGAESLATWLWRKIGRPKTFNSAATAKLELASQTGIIFFKDCFVRPGEVEQRGDHIDLWNKGLTKTYNDPANKSKAVWFFTLA